MEPRVRLVESGDLDEIVTLAVRGRASVVAERGGAALLVDLGLPVDGSDIADSIVDPDRMVWCATLEDVPVGHLKALRCDGPAGRVVVVEELWVEPEAREVGAGESLLSAALAWAIAEEASAIDAYALPGARGAKNLFERMGMTARLLTVRRELA